MAKRFKLRIYRVIASSFQSCRSKEPSTLPTDPVPSFLRLSPVNQNLITIDFQTITTTTPQPTPPSSKHHRSSSSIKRHVSSAFISVGCGFGSKSDVSGDDRTKSQDFQWKKEEEEWQIVAKVYDEVKSPRQKIQNSSVSGDSDVEALALAPPLPPTAEKKKKRRSKKKKTTCKHVVSTSSADSASFCSEEREKEETEILVSSSRSFSTDSNSTEFNPHLETIREKPITTRRHKKKRAKKRRVSKGICRVSVSAPECESPARLSVFKRLIPFAVEGKVKESFAVVKKSEDPYEDFKRSMMDMIWEKQMFEERELEQLLQCFLSLNSRRHHGVIVDVFNEIWNAMFCTTSSRNSKALRWGMVRVIEI